MYSIDRFPGFDFYPSEQRWWNESANLGLSRNDDGTYKLLDADGYPSNHSLDYDNAEYLLSMHQIAGEDPADLLLHWDSYADSLQ